MFGRLFEKDSMAGNGIPMSLRADPNARFARSRRGYIHGPRSS